MKVSLISLTDKRKPSDLFVAAQFEESKSSTTLKKIDSELSKALEHAQSKKRFEGKSGQSLSSYNSLYSEAPEALIAGLGVKKSFSQKTLRKTIGRVLQGANASKFKKVRIFVETFSSGKISVDDVVDVVAELSILSNYSFDQYKKNKKSLKKTVSEIELLFSKKSGFASLEKTIHKAQSVAQGTILARDLINEPANVMNAQRLSLEAKKLASRKKMTCQVLGYSEIKKLKMGGVLAVNQGATTPPAVIILEHGKKYKSKGTVCLVGKGVTFDTGGLSIKPPKGMEKMKYDMSGAAGVIGAMSAVADLNLPVHVVAITPAVENNVAEDPIRPGDIIHMFNGKSVEVLNTDAEGRLILADGLAYAEKYKPKALINMATLTGMAAYTFGKECSAVMGNDQKLIGRLKKAGEESGERCWELPMYEEYGEQIRGQHSDLQNIGGMYGGTITAAKFLEEFVPSKTSWAHLDIAGVAWCDSPRFDCPVGGTGFGVKLLVTALMNIR